MEEVPLVQFIRFDPLLGRSGHTVSLVEGWLYMFGGLIDIHTEVSAQVIQASTRSVNEMYKLKADDALKVEVNWVNIPCEGTVPECVYGHTATVYRHNIYFCGGQDTTRDDVEWLRVYSFDTRTAKWARVTPPGGGQWPPSRWGHTATLVNRRGRDYIMIYGGEVGTKVTDEVWFFDLSDYTMHSGGEFQLRGPAPRARRRHVACWWQEGVYVFGGRGASEIFGDFWRFDLLTLQWKEITFPPWPPLTVLTAFGDELTIDKQQRTGHSAFIRQDRMYVFGGYSSASGHMAVHNDLHCIKLTDPKEWHLVEYALSDKFDKAVHSADVRSPSSVTKHTYFNLHFAANGLFIVNHPLWKNDITHARLADVPFPIEDAELDLRRVIERSLPPSKELLRPWKRTMQTVVCLSEGDFLIMGGRDRLGGMVDLHLITFVPSCLQKFAVNVVGLKMFHNVSQDGIPQSIVDKLLATRSWAVGNSLMDYASLMPYEILTGD